MPQAETPRRFSVHAARGEAPSARIVEEASFEAAALAYLEEFHPPLDPDGEVSVIVRDLADGRQCCLCVDLHSGEAAPCPCRPQALRLSRPRFRRPCGRRPARPSAPPRRPCARRHRPSGRPTCAPPAPPPPAETPPPRPCARPPAPQEPARPRRAARGREAAWTPASARPSAWAAHWLPEDADQVLAIDNTGAKFTAYPRIQDDLLEGKTENQFFGV